MWPPGTSPQSLPGPSGNPLGTARSVLKADGPYRRSGSQWPRVTCGNVRYKALVPAPGLLPQCHLLTRLTFPRTGAGVGSGLGTFCPQLPVKGQHSLVEGEEEISGHEDDTTPDSEAK